MSPLSQITGDSNPPLGPTGWVRGPRMISDTTYNPAPSVSAPRRRGRVQMRLLLPLLYVGAGVRTGIRIVALAAMWRDSCQQDGKPKTRSGWKLSATLQLSPVARQLIPYHCSAVLFVTIGIRDITDVDTDSPANSGGVYLCVWYRLKNIPRWRHSTADVIPPSINRKYLLIIILYRWMDILFFTTIEFLFAVKKILYVTQTRLAFVS